ncbi:MAG: uroporphyrinogen-III synthase [Aquiluna sp.]|jgi:uroporphyrinogen-III synthase
MKILLIRPNRNDADAAALAKFGIKTEIDPYLEISQVNNVLGAQKMLDALRSKAEKWLILTSSNSLQYWQNLLSPGELEKVVFESESIQFAAIGQQTKKQLFALGANEVVVADRFDSASLAKTLSGGKPIPVVIPAGSIAMQTLDNSLSGLGFDVISEVVYQTNPVVTAPNSVRQIAAGVFDAVLLRSPSAARTFLSKNPSPRLSIICGGNTTAKAVQALGVKPDLIAADPSPDAIAKAVSAYFLDRRN